MGRPKINPYEKRNKHISLYVTQELKDALIQKIETDVNYASKGSINTVINKLIYDYVYDTGEAQKSPQPIYKLPCLDGLSNSERSIIESIVSNPVKKKKLFDYISDSITLSM